MRLRSTILAYTPFPRAARARCGRAPCCARGGAGRGAVAAIAAALALAAPPPAAAWGPLGHRTVGAVADALLTKGVRAEVARLLADDRDRDGHLSGRATLAEVSLWADEIRGTDADHPAWHYDDAPACGAPPAQPSWCPRGQCASGRFGPLLDQLADRTQPAEQRRQALKWIAHLVGDLHQPLHASDYAQGGNGVQVQLAGPGHAKLWTLHSAWDIRLVSAAMHAGSSQQPPAPVLKSLILHAQRLTPEQRNAPVGEWVAESNQLARRVALAYPGFACDHVPAEPVQLPVDYQKRAQRVIMLRLAMAGARLATILNRVLGSTTPAPPLPRSTQAPSPPAHVVDRR